MDYLLPEDDKPILIPERYLVRRGNETGVLASYVLRLAKELASATNVDTERKEPNTTRILFDPACPFRFKNPDTVEMLDKSASFTLPNIPYRVLRFVCQSESCCAEITDIAASITDGTEEAVIRAIEQDIKPSLNRSGIALTLSRKSGFVMLKPKES